MPTQGRTTHVRGRVHQACRAAAAAAALPIALSLALAPAADASPNDTPSRALPLTVGVPTTGSWAGTTQAVTYSYSSLRFFTHWWRSPQTLHAGDTVTLAVDLVGQQSTLNLCLVPPVDDLGAAQTLQSTPGCADSEMPYAIQGQRSRINLTYNAASGPAFLVTAAGVHSTDGYTLTVERIVTRVDPGFAVSSRVSRTLRLSASLRYGDNTPVADGIRASLELRTGSRYRRIASGTSIGGNVRLNARLAKSLRGNRIALRVCADQPGGDHQRCSSSRRVRVR